MEYTVILLSVESCLYCEVIILSIPIPIDNIIMIAQVPITTPAIVSLVLVFLFRRFCQAIAKMSDFFIELYTAFLVLSLFNYYYCCNYYCCCAHTASNVGFNF